MFVRQYLEGMARRASAENRKTVRMMLAALYLTPDAMKRADVRIAVAEPAEVPAPARSSVKSRFKVVASGAVDDWPDQ